MFTSYIKSLNDLVFSTAESPEELPSTGVLGRIGSWLSPWKGNVPKSPNENSSSISDWTEDDEDHEGCVRTRAGDKNSSPLGLFQSFLPFEEGDATQSAHRDGSVVSSTQTGEGGPKEEELVQRRKLGTAQGEGREEICEAASTSGSPVKNVSHLTHLSSLSKQGVAWDFDQAHTQPDKQAATGRRLHVYLEETCVIQCGGDTCAEKEVVRTEVNKNLPVFSWAKSPGFSSSPARAEKNVRPAAGAQSFYSTLVGVSLKPHKDSQSESEPDKEQTEADDMGRKNSNRRRVRKNSQGDGGKSPEEKKTEVFSPSSSSVDKGPNAHLNKASADSCKHNPTLLVSPEREESEISSADMVKCWDNLQSSVSVSAATRACEAVGVADMDEDDSLYRVERKTETPESKRRSIKVSHSEVKVFPKQVPFTPKWSTAAKHQDLVATTKNNTAETKDGPDGRLPAEEPKAAVGRIVDKICLFEQQPDGGLHKSIQTSRSADVPPFRKVTDRIKVDFLATDQRSRSAEGYGTLRSSSASPDKQKPMTIKERARRFAEACNSEAKPALTQQMPPVTGTTPTSFSPVSALVSKPSELGNQDELDCKEPMMTTSKSEITPKPDALDGSAVSGQMSTQTGQIMDLKETDTKTVERIPKLNNSSDCADVTDASPSQPKGRDRTGSRSKRRKNKEPASPIGQNDLNTNKTGKNEVEDTKMMSSAYKEIPEAMAEPPPGHKSGPVSDTKQKDESGVSGKQAALSQASIKTENTEIMLNEQEGPAKSSVNADETDIATCGSGTKATVGQEAEILSSKEEKSEEHSLAFTSERLKASVSRSEISAPSSLITSSAGEHLEKPPAAKQKSSTEQPKLAKELSMRPESESKQKGKYEDGTTQRAPSSEPMHQAETEDVVELEMVGSGEANYTEREGTENTDKSFAKGEVSHRGQSSSEKEGSVEKDKSEKPTALPVQLQNVSETRPPENAAICTATQTNEPVCGTESDKKPQKVVTDTSVPPESQSTESSGTRAAEPPPVSVLVEKAENPLNDSCTRGANDAGISNTQAFPKTAAGDERVSATGSKVTPVRKPPEIIVTESKNSNSNTERLLDKSPTSTGVGQTASDSPFSESQENRRKEPNLSKAMSEKSQKPESGVRDAEKVPHSCCDSITSSSTGNETDKPAEKIITQPASEVSPVANGDVSPHSRLHTTKKEPANDRMSQTPKAPIQLESNKPIPDSTHRSAMKKFTLPQELMKADSSKEQDTPSSWLDLDLPKRKLKVPETKLTSSGSESNLLDTSGELDDDDFVEKIKKLCTPFSLPPRKHNVLRPPQPPFAMPAIREDRFEKQFDPEEFTFGLRKKTQMSLETTPSILAKLQSTETKSGLLPARVSVADRSLLLSSLDSHAHLKGKNPAKDGEDAKEEKDEQIKVKSRLERSSILSSLTSSIRGKRNGVQTEAEDSDSVMPGEAPRLSPLPSPQPAPPSPTTTAAVQITNTHNREETRAAETAVSDSGPPLPPFNDIKLPDYLEKYLPQDRAKAGQSVQGQDRVKTELTEKMASGVKGDMVLKPSLPETTAPRFPGIPPTTHSTLPDLKQRLTQPHNTLRDNMRTVKGFHQRPGKMVLYEKAQFSGQTHEIYGDVADASSLELSHLISVKVVRGCWLLYEKPDFQGRIVALEEGNTELENMWVEPETEPDNIPPMTIGSIRLAVRDYSIPHIDLFTEPEGRGRVTPYHDDTVETGSFGIPLNTASIQVHSGVWLLFSDPGYEGMVSVLEKGVFPVPEAWGFPSPFVGSLRPLKMGGFKVENPNEVKAVVYEKPGFEGSSLEIDSDVFSFCEAEGGGIAADGANLDTNNLKSVGSLKIIGGFWVGYSQPGFEGQQHILEEGEYLDCSDWRGAELLSLRPIISDFLSPLMKMFSDKNFGKLGVNVDLTAPVINMDDTGYGMKTQSIDVLGGVWVVFEEPGFSGETYILEKGLYGSPEDWGALQHRVGSAMPVLLDDFVSTDKFKVQLFSDPGFQGSVLVLEDSAVSLQDGFSVASCKVLAGSWLAYESQDFTGKMYVLEEGSYPDLRAMGCVSSGSSILSLQIVGFEFSLPSITLFERCGLRGKRVLLTEGSVNLQLAGGCGRVQSVLVDGGMWVLYEGINYRGAQILLKPGEIPDWRMFSSWQKIGSLRPLIQKQVHFRLRNRQTGLMMSVTGDLDDVKMLRIHETEETDGLEQIWFYYNGHLHCKLLEECCLSPSGSVTIAGSRVGLTPGLDNQTHLWSMTSKGFIHYTPTPDLVLDIKGGFNYDKSQVILNTLDPNKLQQRWDVEII
ncbi:beta/gamma crystallin domain-containing protein 1 isoform X2 [Nothobranchius furzeri]|nr:transcript variant X1 [Nothobranchius furzeri]